MRNRANEDPKTLKNNVDNPEMGRREIQEIEKNKKQTGMKLHLQYSMLGDQ